MKTALTRVLLVLPPSRSHHARALRDSSPEDLGIYMDDREWKKVKKAITLREYINGLIADPGRSGELQSWISMVGVDGVEKLLEGISLKGILQKNKDT